MGNCRRSNGWAGVSHNVQKPTALATDRVFEIADELVSKVKAAAAVHVGSPHAAGVVPTGRVPARSADGVASENDAAKARDAAVTSVLPARKPSTCCALPWHCANATRGLRGF